MNKDCNANKDDNFDCNDDCNGGLDCKNKREQKCLQKKVEVRHAKDGKGSGLFAMEDIEKMTMSKNKFLSGWSRPSIALKQLKCYGRS